MAAWEQIGRFLAESGPAGVIGMLVGALALLASGRVRWERELTVESDRRRLIEAERDALRLENHELREQRDRERDQKIQTLEVAQAAMRAGGRRNATT